MRRFSIFFSRTALPLYSLFPKNIWWFHFYLLTLRLFSCRSLAFEWDRGREPIYRKGVLDALCLTLGNLAVPKRLSNFKATKTPIRCIFMALKEDNPCCLFVIVLFIYRCVGFGVARFDKQAMPEPQNVGRVTGDSHASFMCSHR